MALSSHPFNKFGTGNIKTLKEDVDKSINVRKELLSFHEKYYSSSVMKLAIVGKQDIETLTKLVTNTFSSINNKKTCEPKYSENVFNLKNNPILYKLVPITEKRELKLNWIMPSCYNDTLTKPTSLLSFCLGDESPGSILSYLKELGYATGLMAGLSYNLPEFSLMGCTVYLTPKGLENYNDIINIIYQYINKMKNLTEKDWKNYFNERSKVRLMNFNFKGKEKSYGYSRSLAMNLQKNYPRNEFLECCSGLLFKYDYNGINKFLDKLNVDNCYYQLIAKEFEQECKESEKWYGTMYKTEKIDENLLKQWRECNKNDNDKLYTPLENKYIADDFTILCQENDNKQQDEEDKSLPFVIRETDCSKIWFKQDKTFKKPKLSVNIRLYSPLLNDETLNMSLTDLIILILNDELSDSTYAFEEASLSFNASFNGSNAIQFSFGGYNQKLSLLIDTVLSKFKNLKISKEKYEINKEKYKRIITSMKKSQPYQHCDMIDTLFLCPKSVSLKDLENAYKEISYEKVLKQYERIFNKLYIESLISGNIDDKITIQPYYEIIDKYLIKSIKNKYTLKELENDRNGCLKLEPNNNYCVSFNCPNDKDKNSCISNTYLYKVDNCKDFAVLKLFTHLINAPCFDQLRTKEQLGYIVWSFNDMTKGFMSFRIIIQSNNSNPNKLNCRIETFLKSFKSFIDNMDENTFEINKKSVINNLLEKPKTIYEQNNKYWREIRNSRYQFEREINLAKEIENIKKEDILLFYNEFINSDKSDNSRTKLTIQCYGNQHDMNEKNENDDKESCYDDPNVINLQIDNIKQVRDKCGYYPFPYNDTSKL